MPDIGLSYPSNWGPPNPYREPRHGRHIADLVGPRTLVTAPAGRILTVEKIKSWANVSFDDSDDDIGDLIDDATELAEDSIDGQRQFLTATYQVPVRGWWHGELELPRPPLQTVDSISYYATNGTLTTLASSNYEVLTPERGAGRIWRAPNVIWPTLQHDNRWPILIQFTCGYGGADDVPMKAKQAVAMIVAHSNRYRGDDDETGNVSKLEMPPAAMNRLRALSWGSVF